MKKVTMMIAIVMFFVTSISFAQSNTAVIEQLGNGYEATITQVGDGNSAELFQGMPSWNQPNMKKEGWIEQTGDGNTASVEQASHRSRVGVVQTGDGNETYSKVANTTGGGSVAQAFVTQIGNDNFASQDHSGAGYKPNKVYDIMVINQTGNDNEAYQHLRTNYYESFASITQTGDDNFASQTMQRNMVSQILQEGNDNTASTLQEGKLGNAWIHQDGDFNGATINSFGDDNTAVVNQFGNSNFVEVTQHSSFNSVHINQNGNSGTAIVTQN